MKSVKLPNYPKNLPDDAEVRDFDLGGGKYARVIMEVQKSSDPGGVMFLVLVAQAYQMTSKGQFVTAPLGYPSRSGSTSHSVMLSSVGKTIELDDAWVESPETYDPTTGDLPVHQTRPTESGTAYGEKVWVESEQKVLRWAEGYADIVARTKVEDLLNVLKTSDVRSGFAFRNRRNKES